MHKRTIIQLHTPLSVDPNRTFTILGVITNLERGLKKTIVSVKTIDLIRENNNEDYFNLSMSGQIKSTGDKILEKGDLIHCTGQLSCTSIDSYPEFEIKHFNAWDGMRNMLESTKAVSVPLNNIINPDSAY